MFICSGHNIRRKQLLKKLHAKLNQTKATKAGFYHISAAARPAADLTQGPLEAEKDNLDTGQLHE